mmetsp:Transcript_55281/g.131307  ORF Transcript_55281/g.131307 Transcript_55281/m.131307 type:complete len:214 (+) Transcript_55281:174-815(+)
MALARMPGAQSPSPSLEVGMWFTSDAPLAPPSEESACRIALRSWSCMYMPLESSLAWLFSAPASSAMSDFFSPSLMCLAAAALPDDFLADASDAAQLALHSFETHLRQSATESLVAPAWASLSSLRSAPLSPASEPFLAAACMVRVVSAATAWHALRALAEVASRRQAAWRSLFWSAMAFCSRDMSWCLRPSPLWTLCACCDLAPSSVGEEPV